MNASEYMRAKQIIMFGVDYAEIRSHHTSTENLHLFL